MDTNDNMATEPPPPPSPSPEELIKALDHAAQMAKQLPAATFNPDHHRLIISSLYSAKLSLSSFLSLHHHHHPDNSVSSADEPMMDEDGEDEDEHNSKDSSMEKMEEKMRDSLYIQNKRPKRPLSPSAERQGLDVRERVRVRVPSDFDPLGTRLRNLELVYQFHG